MFRETLPRRRLGITGLDVTVVCAGTSALGNFPAQYGYEVDEAQARQTLLRVFESPINFLDTSNEYGNGNAERRIGSVLALRGGLPDDFVLATKVDPLPGSADFSGERVRRSVEESLERLGLDTLDLVYFHDPERTTFEAATARGGAVDALVELKQQGLVRHLGVAGGPVELLLKYLQLGVFEVVISHNRYTLLDRSAEPLFNYAASHGIGVVNAAPYGGGILARGPDAYPRYAYRPASGGVLRLARRLCEICDSFGVPLAAAALQFSLRDNRVASTIVGISRPEHVDETIRLATLRIPEELWPALDEAYNLETDG